MDDPAEAGGMRVGGLAPWTPCLNRKCLRGEPVACTGRRRIAVRGLLDGRGVGVGGSVGGGSVRLLRYRGGRRTPRRVRCRGRLVGGRDRRRSGSCGRLRWWPW